MSSGRDIVSLTLDSSERGDAGNWTCTAQVYETGSLTVGGPEERSVQLVVVGRFSIKHLDLHTTQTLCLPIVAPSTPEDLTVEKIGATWIFLSWIHVSDGIPSFSRVVIVVTEGEPGRNMTVETGSPAVNVTDLQPGTDYTFRVVAVSVFDDVQAPSPPSPPFMATTNTSGVWDVFTPMM